METRRICKLHTRDKRGNVCRDFLISCIFNNRDEIEIRGFVVKNSTQYVERNVSSTP